jgi:hypothetical protein
MVLTRRAKLRRNGFCWCMGVISKAKTLRC